MTPMSYIAGAGIIGAAVLFGLWRFERANNAILTSNNQVLIDSVAEQKDTITQMTADAETQKEALDERDQTIRVAEQEALAATLEINGLRTTIRSDLRNNAGPVADLLDKHLNDGLRAVGQAFGNPNGASETDSVPPADTGSAPDARVSDPSGY